MTTHSALSWPSRLLLAAAVSLWFGCPSAWAQDRLAWDANPPVEAVEGYRVHWGATPAVGDGTLDVGPVLEWPITGLEPPLYFAVTAYRGVLESGLSATVLWESSGTDPPQIPAPACCGTLAWSLVEGPEPMAFPTTSVLDNFNRANEGPPPSSSWSTPSFVSGMVVSSNAVAGSAVATCAAIYNVATYGADCEAYATIAVKPAVSNTVSLVVRGQQVASAATIDGYILVAINNSGTDQFIIARLDNGAQTNLGVAHDQEYSAGDAFGLEAVGSTLTAYRKPSGGSWASMFSRTDSTYSAAGNIGMIVLDTTARLDDFGGGTVVAGGVVIPVFMAQYRQRVQ